MKSQNPPAAASSATIRRHILASLTQAGLAVTLAHQLSEALATVQHKSGVLVILALLDPQEG